MTLFWEFNKPWGFLSNIRENVRFEVFTAVTMKNGVFWDVVQCTSCVNRRFGQTYRLHLQGRKICARGTSVGRFTQEVHGATCQKTVFFIRKNVRISYACPFRITLRIFITTI
jgi:hypothetical protein